MPNRVLDEEIVSQLRKESKRFRDFEKRHELLSEKLDVLQRRKTLLPIEEAAVRQIHKEKLVVKDGMADLVREFSRKKGVRD